MSRPDLSKVTAPSPPPPPPPPPSDISPTHAASLGCRAVVLGLLLLTIWGLAFSLAVLLPAYLVYLPGRGEGRDVWLRALLITGSIHVAATCYLAFRKHWFRRHVDSRLTLLRAELPHTQAGLSKMVSHLEGLVWAFSRSGMIGRNTFLVADRPEGDISTICDSLRRFYATARRLLDSPSSNPAADRIERGNLESAISEFVRVMHAIGDPDKTLGEKIWERKYFFTRMLREVLGVAIVIQGFCAGYLWFEWYRYYPTF